MQKKTHQKLVILSKRRSDITRSDIIDVTQINTSQGMYDSLHIKVYYRNIAGVVSFTQGFKLVQEPFHSVV